MNNDARDREKRDDELVLLKDLVPRKDPKGGKGEAGKSVFGERPVVPVANEAADEKTAEDETKPDGPPRPSRKRKK